MARRRLRKRISDVKIREIDFRDALAEATTLKDLVAREANELADIVYQAIADDPDEDLDEGPDDEPNEDLRRLIHRSMVLDEMTWPIDLIIHGLRSKTLSDIQGAFQENSKDKLTETVQYSYNHFPTLRGMVWPTGIAKLSDYYYNVGPKELYKVFSEEVDNACILKRYFDLRKARKKIRKWPERPTEPISQPAQPQECKTRLDIRDFRVLPWNYENIVFKDLVWDVRRKPSELTTKCTENLDDVLFGGPVLLDLPNISEALFYRVPIKGRQTARATLMAIYEFYQAHESKYTIGDRVWAGALVETTPQIWQFKLRKAEAIPGL